MPLPRFRRKVREDFVVIDSNFPQKEPLGFRNSEINEYLDRIKNFASYSMYYPMEPPANAPFGHRYGMTPNIFKENIAGYLRHYPKNKGRIHHLKRGKRYNFKLAHSFFLAETYSLLPFYEANDIPFSFVLYPGGLFGLHTEASDDMLKRIFASPCFRAVIVTQQITRDYLISEKLCDPKHIHFIYGGYVQFKPEDVKPKRHYPTEKPTFDICFVAAKYAEKGIDKGYDLFVDTSRLLLKKHQDYHFHVVGGFDEQEIDVSDMREHFTFYGYKKPDALLDFYSSMDVMLTPNRPFQLFGGNFDGFPLGIDAAYCGVALFTADELKMNHHYKDGKEIVIIPLDAKRIADTIEKYHAHPKRLYDLSLAGQKRFQEVFDIDYQTTERIKVFSKYVTLEPTSKSLDHTE